MTSKFGFLSKLNFLQNWVSRVIAGMNPAIIHNVEKYTAIKKVVYLNSIEQSTGDYLEFGVFTGSSFCHSIRCFDNMKKFNPKQAETAFFGFDSFEGFGDLSDMDKHPFYVDENFATSYDNVFKRVKKVAKDYKFQLVKGYFSDSLKAGPASFGIKKARVIFIDSDTYSSSIDALNFCADIVQQGTYVILDDFYSYNGNPELGVCKAFREFIDRSSLNARRVFEYGNGGAVFVLYAGEKKNSDTIL